MKKPNRVGAGEHSRRLIVAQVTEDTSGAAFETDKSITDTPTQYLTFNVDCEIIEIVEVYRRITPTNAETYRLMLFQGPLDDDTLHEAEMNFDSGLDQVSGQPYRDTQGGPKLPVFAKLTTEGRLYYATDWTNTPGNTTGVLVVKALAVVGDTFIRQVGPARIPAFPQGRSPCHGPSLDCRPL